MQFITIRFLTQTLLSSVPQADQCLRQKPVLHFDRQALDPTASLVEAAPAHWC